MASKGQKFKKFSPEVKAEILRRYFAGDGTPRSLGREFGLSFRTIETWISKSRRGIDVTVDHRPGNTGRKKGSGNMTEDDLREQVEILKKYRAFLKARTGRK